MKVTVKESGFYAGTWHDAGPAEIEMPERIAKAFLPPRGHQLAPVIPAAAPAVSGKSEPKAE